MAKKELAPTVALAPVPAVLVSCGVVPEEYNIMAASWCGTCCSRPPMAYVSLRPATLSHGILCRTGEFVINLPTRDQLELVDWCGTASGREHRKFQEKGLTPVPGSQIAAPAIAECPVNIELRVVHQIHLGSHDMFVGEVLAVHAEEGLVDANGRIRLEDLETVCNMGSRYVALGVYILACLTDLLDGYVARHYNQLSDFGKFADPLADKCLVMAALCWFVETGDMVGWVLAVVLLREFAVSGMRLIAVEKGRVIAAGWSGKVKTASTMVCICLMLFGIPHWLNLVCQGVILVTTVYSGVEYFAKNWDVFQENK